jgi:hypothetical protein
MSTKSKGKVPYIDRFKKREYFNKTKSINLRKLNPPGAKYGLKTLSGRWVSRCVGGDILTTSFPLYSIKFRTGKSVLRFIKDNGLKIEELIIIKLENKDV